LDDFESECTSLVFRRLVVALDPSGSGDADADEVGIIVAGLDEHDRGWVIADASGRYNPIEWGKIAVRLYHQYRCDRIIAERNFGGDMIEAVIRSIDPNVAYASVVATRGKITRAEPISALYEQSRVFHLGSFPTLEDEMCGFTSNFDRTTAGYSPNRVDALVWALTELMTRPMSSYGIFEIYRCAAMGRPVQPADNRLDWKIRYDELAASDTPNHPDCRGGEVEWLNTERALLPRPVDRMLERCAEENIRFAELSRDRMPTPEEAAAHVDMIDNIKRGR
jgi:hypothetical protein